MRQLPPLKDGVLQIQERKKGVKGETKSMLRTFLQKELAPKIKRMKATKVIIGLDKGLHLKKEEVLESIQAGGAKNILMHGYFQLLQQNMSIPWTIHYGILSKNVFGRGNHKARVKLRLQ